MTDVLEWFKEDGYTLVTSEAAVVARNFCMDTLCNDVFMFSAEERGNLMEHDLVLAGKLVLQVCSVQLFNENNTTYIQRSVTYLDISVP